jgi:hypothetical protein
VGEVGKRELMLLSEDAEVPGRGAGSHRERIKRCTSKVRRADGKRASASGIAETDQENAALSRLR